MANCVQCGSKIKENSSFCPVCGCRNPLDKKNKTDDYTLAFNDLGAEYPIYEPKSASRACLLACLCGWTGLHYKYLEYKRLNIFAIMWSLLALIGGFLLGFFVTKHDIALGIIIGILLMYVVNVADGLSFLIFKRRDGHGEVIL